MSEFIKRPGKIIVSGISKRNGSVDTETAADYRKKTLQTDIRRRIKPEAVIYSGGWRGGELDWLKSVISSNFGIQSFG